MNFLSTVEAFQTEKIFQFKNLNARNSCLNWKMKKIVVEDGSRTWSCDACGSINLKHYWWFISLAVKKIPINRLDENLLKRHQQFYLFFFRIASVCFYFLTLHLLIRRVQAKKWSKKILSILATARGDSNYCCLRNSFN